MRHSSNVRGCENQMTRKVALRPSRKHGSRQISLRKIVEAEDALVLNFRSAGKRMQSTAPGVAYDRVHARELFESRADQAFYLAGLGNVGGEIQTRRRRNLPINESTFGFVVGFYVGEHQRSTAFDQPSHDVLGNCAQSPSDQNRFA